MMTTLAVPAFTYVSLWIAVLWLICYILYLHQLRKNTASSVSYHTSGTKEAVMNLCFRIQDIQYLLHPNGLPWGRPRVEGTGDAYTIAINLRNVLDYVKKDIESQLVDKEVKVEVTKV